MANPDRDSTYRDDTTTNRTVYSRRSNATGWFVGIVVALALLAIGFLVFNANTGPATTTVDTTVTPAPATDTMITEPAPATDTTTNEMTTAPAAEVPADTAAPATDTTATDPAVTPVEEAPAPVAE